MLTHLMSLLLVPTTALAATDLAVVNPSQWTALLYCCIMVLSAFGFFAMRQSYGTSVPLIFYFIHTGIVLWSGLQYVHFVFNTDLAAYAYYMDWIVSTPLIVLALALTGMIQAKEKSWTNTLGIIFCQVVIIVTGLFAQLTGPTNAGITFFALGNIAMLGVFYFIWGPFMSIAKASSVELFSKYRFLGIYVILLWIAYPVIWLLGTPGLKIISENATHLWFIFLPIVCKAGFGFLDLYLLNKLSKELNQLF